MELVVVAITMILSIACGVTATRAMLSTVLFLMARASAERELAFSKATIGQ